MDMSKFTAGATELNLAKEMAALGLDSGLDQLAGAAGVLDRAFDETVASAVSPDRLVKVTVTGRGEVRAIEFDPGIYRDQDAQQLAAAIVATLGQAHAAAAAKMTAAYDTFREVFDD
ncbi:YbaB/EbfC family nucleoid-associated protein [Kribbella sp. NPDC004875]|uniref:YbaB/EbfC family nucleoid-associated protein n=1 Tax=Kribbella sp. NPDC004875 TaxID=3364107 RepID=UPI0036D03A84